MLVTVIGVTLDYGRKLYFLTYIININIVYIFMNKTAQNNRQDRAYER